ELLAVLRRPRRLIMLVKAGEVVDQTIAQLRPLLNEADMIVDGGNEHFRNTERRAKELAADGLRFFGMGVSGGEEGARFGPSLMPGGERDGYDDMAPILTKIAAQVEDGPCVTYCGPGGAGHYVKMVHNGIEYGDMQLIAEAYDVLKTLGGLDTAELGAPVPTIAASVDARIMSSDRAGRLAASSRLAGPTPAPRASSAADKKRLVDDVRAALYAAKACAYAQGMNLLRLASGARAWDLDLAELARIWKGGCIIRAQFLGRIQAAFRADRALPNLLLDAGFRDELAARQDPWRRVIAE